MNDQMRNDSAPNAVPDAVKVIYANSDEKRFMKTPPGMPSVLSTNFEAGKILPFAMLFAESEHNKIYEDERVGKEIIQFSFLITNDKNEVLLYDRVKNKVLPNDPTGRSGHNVSTQKSILVSWSPYLDRFNGGFHYPKTEDDVRMVFHREVSTAYPPDELTFLGLIRNDKTISWKEGRIRYFFYLFEAHYKSDISADKFMLQKDRSDIPEKFSKIDQALLKTVSGMKADVQALVLYQQTRYGEDILPVAPDLLGESKSILNAHSTPFWEHSPGLVISHTSKDHPHTQWLVEYLRQRNIRYWIDDDPRHMSHNTEWYKTVEPALRYGDGVIFVCTPHVSTSKGMRDEIGIASKVRKERASFVVMKLVFEELGDKEISPELEEAFGKFPNFSVVGLPLEEREKRLDVLFEEHGFL